MQKNDVLEDKRVESQVTLGLQWIFRYNTKQMIHEEKNLCCTSLKFIMVF